MHGTREIVTFQFGNYANYIGAHLWNLQEAGFKYDSAETPGPINHDILYRQGIVKNDCVTYTPRVLAIDLEGALKHLPIEGELYGGHAIKRNLTDSERKEEIKKVRVDLGEENPEQTIEIVETPQVEPHEYQQDLNTSKAVDVQETDYNLSESVDSWADYLYARYHPRTMHIVREYKHSPEIHGIDTYTSGTTLWNTVQLEDEFCDRIRMYVEECDYFQGFQTIFDADNGFGGLAGKCIEYLDDEYRRANITFPVYQPRNLLYQGADQAMSDSIRVVNSALCFQALIEQTVLFTPLSTLTRVWRQLGESRNLNNLRFTQDNLYQTSAILAAYLDTITLSYRLRNAPPPSNSLSKFVAHHSNYGRRLAAAAISLPLPMRSDEDLIDCLDQRTEELYTQLTPNCRIGTDYVVQSMCVRGIPEKRLKTQLNQRQMRMAAYRCDRISEMFQLYFQCKYHASMAYVTAIESPMPTKTPFPRELFAEASLNANGFHDPNATQLDLQSVPVLAAMQTSGDIANMIQSLHDQAQRVKLAKLHRFRVAGLEVDDYQETLEQLLCFKDNYEDTIEI